MTKKQIYNFIKDIYIENHINSSKKYFDSWTGFIDTKDGGNIDFGGINANDFKIVEVSDTKQSNQIYAAMTNGTLPYDGKGILKEWKKYNKKVKANEEYKGYWGFYELPTIEKDMELMADFVAQKLLEDKNITSEVIEEMQVDIENEVKDRFDQWFEKYGIEEVPELVKNLDKKKEEALIKTKEKKIEEVYQNLTDIPKYKSGTLKDEYVDIGSNEIEDIIWELEREDKEFSKENIEKKIQDKMQEIAEES